MRMALVKVPEVGDFDMTRRPQSNGECRRHQTTKKEVEFL